MDKATRAHSARNSTPSRLPDFSERAVPLDRRLRQIYPDESWGHLRRWITTGKVSVNGEVVLEVTARVSPTAELIVARTAQNPKKVRLQSDRLLYVDSQIVVVNKPAGISSIPYDENEHGTLDELVRRALANQGSIPPLGVVHRIDKETSGVLVFARTVPAKHALKQQFRVHSVRRCYLAIATGTLRACTFESRLVQDRGDGRRGSITHPELGRLAITHVRPVESLSGATLIECVLETGRTHQIRIHLSEAGFPLVGERVYHRGKGAVEALTAPRLMLHARDLAFEHPSTGKTLSFTVPPPQDFMHMLESLRHS